MMKPSDIVDMAEQIKPGCNLDLAWFIAYQDAGIVFEMTRKDAARMFYDGQEPYQDDPDGAAKRWLECIEEMHVHNPDVEVNKVLREFLGVQEPLEKKDY